jgi:hypothetical protein
VIDQTLRQRYRRRSVRNDQIMFRSDWDIDAFLLPRTERRRL